MRGSEGGLGVRLLFLKEGKMSEKSRREKQRNEKMREQTELCLHSAHIPQNISSALFRHDRKLQYDALGLR